MSVTRSRASALADVQTSKRPATSTRGQDLSARFDEEVRMLVGCA